MRSEDADPDIYFRIRDASEQISVIEAVPSDVLLKDRFAASQSARSDTSSLRNYQTVPNLEIRGIMRRFGAETQWGAFVSREVARQHNRSAIFLDADYSAIQRLSANVVFEKNREDFKALGLEALYERLLARQRSSACSCSLRAIIADQELRRFVERSLVF